MHTRSDAVSEVIGVMILLGITIVIFAVVAAFAGGMMSSPDKAITSSISAVNSSSEGELNITFENTAGGAFWIGDIRIVLTNETRAGVTIPGGNMTSISGNETIMTGGQFYLNTSEISAKKGERVLYQIFDAKHETPVTSGAVIVRW